MDNIIIDNLTLTNFFDTYKKCRKCAIIKPLDCFAKKYASCKDCRRDIRQHFNKKYYNQIKELKKEKN